MCIILKSITETPKVVESDMITYKVLEVIEDEATGKESYYSPLSQNRLQYNIGKLYTEHIGRTEDVLGIEEGIETYTCAITTTGLYSYRDIDKAKLLILIMFSTMNIKYKLFRCKVPKGSKYYSSDKGMEIVSDNLVILNQI